MNRPHITLPVSHLDASASSYETLLGKAPDRTLPGYVQFLLEDPAINLALTETAGAKPHAGHFGLEVAAVDQVEQALDRVRSSGVAVEVEQDTRCCYSRQTKFWATDPDGRRWEVFYVAEREAGSTQEPDTTVTVGAACCAG